MHSSFFVLFAVASLVACQIARSPNSYFMSVSMPSPTGLFNGTTSSYRIAIDRNTLRFSQYSIVADLGYRQAILANNAYYVVVRHNETEFKYNCTKQVVSDQMAKYMINSLDLLHTFALNSTFVGNSFAECPNDLVPLNVNTYAIKLEGTSMLQFACVEKNYPKYVFQYVPTLNATDTFKVKKFVEQVSNVDFSLFAMDPSTCGQNDEANTMFNAMEMN